MVAPQSPPSQGGYITDQLPTMADLMDNDRKSAAENSFYLDGCPDLTALIAKVRDVAQQAQCTGRIGALPVQAIPDRVKQIFAYRRWEQRGRPLWEDLQDWFAAEHEIRMCIRGLSELGQAPGQVVAGNAKQVLAYLRWEEQGRPTGTAEADWNIVEAGLAAVAALE